MIKQSMFSVFFLFMASIVICSGAVYKEGKMVMNGGDCEVEITKMKWAKLNDTQDWIVGTTRLYLPQEQLFQDITLTFDVVDNKGEVIESIDIAFNLKTYGYNWNRTYGEGDFSAQFDHPEDAGKLKLVNVRRAGTPVMYKTSFNISGSLMRTLMKIQDPRKRK